MTPPLVPLAADDAAVIEASRTEPDRFAPLFDRHAPHIHRYLARRVGRQAADDLVAETFLVAFGKRARYDLRFRDARPWLYGIATNLVGQHRREEARQFRLRQAAGPAPVQHDYAERTVADLTAAFSFRTLRGPRPGHRRDRAARARPGQAPRDRRRHGGRRRGDHGRSAWWWGGQRLPR